MELQEFITETLVQIQEGVQGAITRRGENTGAIGAISPAWIEPNVDWEKYVQKVEFDVAVTASEKTTASGKGSVKVLALGEVGGDGSKAWERNTVSRVKFSVPIVPPGQSVKRFAE